MQQSFPIPSHHPSEAILVAYGSGALGEAESVVVATHLACCGACRVSTRLAEALGGALLEAAAPVEVSDRSLSALLRRLDEAPGAATPLAVGSRIDGAPAPASLEAYPIGGWRWLGPGVRSIDLVRRTRRAAGLHLFKIAPGRELPEHGHGGLELTCVLSGSFSDASGTYRAGDVQEVDGEIEHGPVAGPEGPCVCVASSDAPMQFRGLLLRLIRPWFGV